MNPNPAINKKRLLWILPSIAIVVVLAFFVVQHIIADDAQGSHAQTNPTGQIDPMVLVHNIWALEARVGTDCGNQCEDCIEDFAMMQEMFREWNSPHYAYLEDFDYLIEALAANTPAFYGVMPYVDAVRMQLQELTHINDMVFHVFLVREMGLGFLRNVDIPMMPMPITQMEEMHGDFDFNEFLAQGGVDLNFVVLPNSNIAVFLPCC